MVPPATTVERTSARQRRRQPVQARSRERIDLIIDTAAALVDSCGAESVTTTLIAEHAGISVGSIYSYFRDRSAIFDAIVRRSIARLDVVAFEARDRHAGSDFVTASWAVIDAIAELYRTAPGFRSLYLSQFVSPEMLATMQESDEEHVRLLLERMRRDSGQYLDCDDPTMAMRLYVGLVDKGLDLAFRIDPEGDPQMITETKEAVALYLGALLRPLPTSPDSATPEEPR
ncbi:MAG: hypothetical protein RJB61_785 [Actinomycetota bacterium]